MIWGTVLSHMGDTVTVAWDDDDEHFEVWDGRECRYRVDRGQMRFIPPPKERRIRLPDTEIFCKICGKPRQLKCGCPRPGALKPEYWGGQSAVQQLLTPLRGHDMMDISIGGNTHDEDARKGAMMAKRKAAEVIEEAEELEELEELDQVTESDDEVEGASDMLTAKAAATKIGTDGRTLRKFLRKKHGTVGQGQRWEIDANDIDALKAEFDAWGKGGGKSEPKPKADKAPAKGKSKVRTDDEIYGPEPDAEFDELEEIEDLDDIEELD